MICLSHKDPRLMALVLIYGWHDSSLQGPKPSLRSQPQRHLALFHLLVPTTCEELSVGCYLIVLQDLLHQVEQQEEQNCLCCTLCICAPFQTPCIFPPMLMPLSLEMIQHTAVANFLGIHLVSQHLAGLTLSPAWRGTC